MTILKNANVLTMAAGRELERGDIAIDNGVIVSVEASIKPGNDDCVIDLAGMTATPGLIDAHCHLGMWEDGIGFEGADGNECTDPVTPHLRAIDAVNPLDRCFEEAYQAGITSVVTGPGSANVIGGQFAAIKTCGKCIDEMIISAPAAMKFAFGENPKRVYHEQEKTPTTRMAAAALIRESLTEAGEYARKYAQGQEDAEKLPERDLKMEALKDVLEKKLLVKAHAHRADDILTALRIAREFGLDMTIEHGTEGYLIADALKKAGAKLILGPLIGERGKVELRNQTLKAPMLLHEKGISFAIMTDHPVVPIQYLSLCAALAVREGLDAYAALEAITINAAKICRIDSRVGSLEAGKDADIAVFDAHPLDFRARVIMTIIDGRIVHDARGIFK